MKKHLCLLTSVLLLVFLVGCGSNQNKPEDVVESDPMKYMKITDYKDKKIAVPMGTVAGNIVTMSYESPIIVEYPNINTCVDALTSGQVDAVAYDTPILQHIALMDNRVGVISKKLFDNVYAFGVSKDNEILKNQINSYVDQIKGDGTYHDMVVRWVRTHNEHTMPEFTGTNGTLKFATCPEVPPFSFKQDNKIVGFDIELASRVAQSMNKKLEIVEVPFNKLTSTVASGKADFCGALLTVTEERQKDVNFSNQTYEGGISLMVLKKPL